MVRLASSCTRTFFSLAFVAIVMLSVYAVVVFSPALKDKLAQSHHHGGHHHNQASKSHRRHNTNQVKSKHHQTILPGSELILNQAQYNYVQFAEYAYFWFDGASQDDLKIKVKDVTSNATLSIYVAYNSAATVTNYDEMMTANGPGESLSVHLGTGTSGRYSVAVYGFQVDNSAKFKIELAADGSADPITLFNGAVTNGTLHFNDTVYYTFVVPANIVNFQLAAKSSNGGGHAHTWVGFGFLPDPYNFNYASDDHGEDACIFAQLPMAGTYYVAVEEYLGDVREVEYYIELWLNADDAFCNDTSAYDKKARKKGTHYLDDKKKSYTINMDY